MDSKLLISIFLLASSQALGNEIEDKMKADYVIPDVLDETPCKLLAVQYPTKSVELGVELKPVEVKDEPEIIWESDPSKLYTLIKVDPDAPSSINQVKHWFVGNIKGNDLGSGQVMAQYRGAEPPEGTGIHRYIFLIYEQEGPINYDDEPRIDKDALEPRLHFSLRNFTQKYNFGKPYAGNYYRAQFDEYVAGLKNQQ